MERWVATVLAPTDAAGGLEILVDEVAALLEVVDAFDAVAPSELLPNDLGLLDLDPLLPHDVLPHLQHRHRVLVRIRRIEIVRRRLLELNIPLLPSHSLSTRLLLLLIEFVCSLRLVFPLLSCLGLSLAQ